MIALSKVPRRWLITGGSRGIGKAVAARAVANGDRVCILSRSDEGNRLAEQLGESAMAVVADVGLVASVEAGVRQAADRWGGLDIVVNNAGLHRGGRVNSLTVDDWDQSLATNLSGPFHVIRAALPYLSAGAAILNIGAVVGFRGFPGDSSYGASKAGLAGLTQILAVELAPRGIRVNLVVPGFVMSEMTASVSARARANIVAKIPLGRMGTTEEIAEVCWWVAGSTYMTGSVVVTDGGLKNSL